MTHYILVIKEASREDVMKTCLLATQYEQVKKDVHCWYGAKRHATEDAKTYADANPGADLILCRLLKDGRMEADDQRIRSLLK